MVFLIETFTVNPFDTLPIHLHGSFVFVLDMASMWALANQMLTKVHCIRHTHTHVLVLYWRWQVCVL